MESEECTLGCSIIVICGCRGDVYKDVVGGKCEIVTRGSRGDVCSDDIDDDVELEREFAVEGEGVGDGVENIA